MDARTSVVESKPAGGDAVIVHIRGALDGSCEEELSMACGCAVGQSRRIYLDLSGAAHIDPEGAGLLITQAALAAGRRLTIGAFGLRDDLRDVFRLTRLDEAVLLFESEEDALACKDLSGRRPVPSGARRALTGPPLPGWAPSVDRLSVRDIPAGVMNINVNGRRTTSPARGFGRLWDKKYRLRLHDREADPRRVVSLWRSAFPEFWPRGNRLFPSEKAPIVPGMTAVLNLSIPGGLTLATGIMVMYVDEMSFSFMTVEGHMLSGWITFSSFRESGVTVLQVHPLFRASDPLMELALRLGGAGQEDLFWHRTLNNLARRLGSHGPIGQQNTVVDGRLNWGDTGNLVKNAAIRSSLYMPLHVLRKILHRKG